MLFSGAGKKSVLSSVCFGPDNAKLGGEIQRLREQVVSKDVRLDVLEARGQGLEETLRGAVAEVETQKADQQAMRESEASLGIQYHTLKVHARLDLMVLPIFHGEPWFRSLALPG
jgi:hypothetical protein